MRGEGIREEEKRRSERRRKQRENGESSFHDLAGRRRKERAIRRQLQEAEIAMAERQREDGKHAVRFFVFAEGRRAQVLGHQRRVMKRFEVLGFCKVGLLTRASSLSSLHPPLLLICSLGSDV